MPKLKIDLFYFQVWLKQLKYRYNSDKHQINLLKWAECLTWEWQKIRRKQNIHKNYKNPVLILQSLKCPFQIVSRLPKAVLRIHKQNQG